MSTSRSTARSRRWSPRHHPPATSPQQLVVSEIAVTGGLSQRWRQRRHSWVRTSAGGFDPDRYTVAVVDESTCRTFIVEHHYSRSFPAAQLCVGLFDRTFPARFGQPGYDVGSLVLSVPVQERVLTGVLPQLEPYRESMELGRLVLLDAVPANAETFFVARAMRIAAERDVVACVAFCDPVQRRNRLTGDVILPGHIGTVYQAANAVYTGRTSPTTKLLLPDGTVLNSRSIQKVRAQERGAAGVERRLVYLGATPRKPDQDPSAWIRTALVAVGAHRFRHGGMHRYILTTPRARGHRRLRVAVESQHYPTWRPAA